MEKWRTNILPTFARYSAFIALLVLFILGIKIQLTLMLNKTLSYFFTKSNIDYYACYQNEMELEETM